jgi:hypothetical protein
MLVDPDIPYPYIIHAVKNPKKNKKKLHNSFFLYYISTTYMPHRMFSVGE